MTLPKMILFDYGNTLACEPDYNRVNAEKALLSKAVKNRDNLSAEEVVAFSGELHRKVTVKAREIGHEIHFQIFHRLLFEMLGIEVPLPPAQIEKIYWDNASAGCIMPDAEKILSFINTRGIRSGVISNISFSGQALKDRLDRLFPENRFEFIIASSEYAIRKPDPMLFRLALKKAGLTAGEVWYCGDSIKNDVYGAASAGIFPVLYKNSMELNYRKTDYDDIPECDCIQITEWRELIDILVGL